MVLVYLHWSTIDLNPHIRIINKYSLYLLDKNRIYLEGLSQVWSPLELCVPCRMRLVCNFWHQNCTITSIESEHSMKPLAWSLHCCWSFLAACVSSATTAQSSPGSGLIVVFVDEEYGEEDALATVAIGLVLGCLLVVVRDHHPILVVRSGSARTLPARQQEKAEQCHPVDGGLAVAGRVDSTLSKRRVPQGTGRCRLRCPFGI